MASKHKPTTHGSRIPILIVSLFLGAALTTGLVQTFGSFPTAGAPSTALAAPDADILCEDGWTCTEVDDRLDPIQELTDHYFRYNKDGDPCLAFGGDGLYFACFDRTENRWESINGNPDYTAWLVDGNPLVGSHASLDFNSFGNDGTPFISYYDGLNGTLKMAYYNGSNWVPVTIVTAGTFCTSMDDPVYETSSADAQIAIPADGESWLRALNPGKIAGENPLEPMPEALISSFNPLASEVKGVGKFTSISVDPANGVHVSFHDELNRQLKYYYLSPSIETCAIVDEELDPQDYTIGEWSSIDTYGSPPSAHISYYKSKYDIPKYAKSKAGSKFDRFRIEDSHLPDNGGGTYSSIAVNNGGVPHMSYHREYRDNDNRGQLRHAYINNGLVEANIEDDGNGTDNVGKYSSIAYDSDNDQYISYYDVTNHRLKIDGKSEPDFDEDHDVGWWTSIDTYPYGDDGDNDTVGVAYINATTGHLIVSENRGGQSNWVNLGGYVAEFSFGNVGLHTSLVFDQTDDTAHISYHNGTNNSLLYALGNPPYESGYWNLDVVVDEYDAGTYSSIGISGTVPVIAYYDMDEEDLEFAEWDNIASEWITDEIDTDGNVGMFVDMVIDSNNIPHISYYDATEANLNYATWLTPTQTWFTKTWATEGVMDGLYTSIDLSPNDDPYIAYYDFTNNEIELMFRSPPPFNAWSDPPVTVDTGIGDIGDDPDFEDIEAYLSIDYEDPQYPNPDNPTEPYTDTVHISYYDATTEGSVVRELKYRKGEINNSLTGLPDFASELVTTLDANGDVGLYNSIGVYDPTGERHICYYDKTNGDLKLVSDMSPYTWGIPEIIDNGADSIGDTGLFCSLALSNFGDVGISYYNKTQGSLWFAHLPYVWRVFLPLVFK